MPERPNSRSGRIQPSSETRVFQCRICSRSFEKNGHLVRHVRSHTQERPFKCHSCGSRYNRRDILVRHQRNVRCGPNTVSRQPSVPVSVRESVPSEQHPRTIDAAEEHHTCPQIVSQTTIQQAEKLAPGILDASQDSSLSALRTTPTLSTLSDCNTTSTIASSAEPQIHTFGGLATFAEQPGSPSELFLPMFLDVDTQFMSQNLDIEFYDYPMDTNLLATEQDFFLPSSTDPELLHLANVHSLWYNNVTALESDTLYPSSAWVPSVPDSPVVSDDNNIDECRRQGLEKRLIILYHNPAVPTTDHLNVLIRLYFMKVHPIFPLVHPATFRPSKSNHSLVIAMCCLGSLFDGSDQALRQAVHLYERIHKSSLVNWELLVRKKQDSLRNMVQCAVIAQVLAILAGSPALLVTADSFWGPPVAWSRMIKLHKRTPEFSLDPDVSKSRLDEVWRAWAQREEMIRLAQGVFIIDAELATICHHEPCQNFESYEFGYCSSDQAFNAASPEQWRRELLKECRTTHPSSKNIRPLDRLGVALSALADMPATGTLGAYAILRAVGLEVRYQRPWEVGNEEASLKMFHRTMVDFYQRVIQTPIARASPLQLHCLWHTVYLLYYVDLDLLEMAVGRDGRKLSDEESQSLKAWAESDEARMCVYHGIMLVKEVQEMPFGREMAIHVPHALFSAGLALECYTRYGCPGREVTPPFPPPPPSPSPPMPTAAPTRATTAAAITVSLTAAKSTAKMTADHLENNTFFSIAQLSILPESSSIFKLLFEIDGRDARAAAHTLRTMYCEITDMLQHVQHWDLAKRFATILKCVGGGGVST